ncbi:permease [Nocardioides coralli]|uniref:permease n=1 Tax=Nocardioides coralli TaxID=2872154 RepID=UPI002016B8EE|nr:permease [Nocardioides coralli]
MVTRPSRRPGTVDTVERPPSRRIGQSEIVIAALVVLTLSQGWLIDRLDHPGLQTWGTLFVAIVIQATPFLVGGVLLAGLISTFMSERALQRIVPRNSWAGVPAAGVAGVALPGCECASVPVASSLVRRGVAPAVALTFMMASPAVNPVVLVSTAVAFPGRPEVVLARFLASLAASVAVGWVWIKLGQRVPLQLRRRRSQHDHGPGGGLRRFAETLREDFLNTAGFLVLGAMIAATVSAFAPRELLESVAGSVVLSVLSMAVFAFVVAMCSEADAFVAASLTMFSDSAKLVFMVVGPAMDVKLAAMQTGQFGLPFALRFVPLVLLATIASALGVGWWLL